MDLLVIYLHALRYLPLNVFDHICHRHCRQLTVKEEEERPITVDLLLRQSSCEAKGVRKIGSEAIRRQERHVETGYFWEKAKRVALRFSPVHDVRPVATVDLLARLRGAFELACVAFICLFLLRLGAALVYVEVCDLSVLVPCGN
jgi:hypothetical protein